MHHLKEWFEFIPYINRLPSHIATSALIVIVSGVLSIIFYYSYKKYLSHNKLNLFPQKINVYYVVTTILSGAYDFALSVIGQENAKHVPLILAIFLYMFISNVIGIIPSFQSPTTNINTNLAAALFVLIYYNYFGIKEHGWNYISKFTGPVKWMVMIMIPIQIIGHVVRPMSLSLRIFGNMNGDHLVMTMFYSLGWDFYRYLSEVLGFIGEFIGISLMVIFPLILYASGIFIAFIQAFVFSLLTMVYLQDAKS